MIENLSEEQEAQMEVYYQKWLKIGLSTGPANREKAAAAIEQMYKVADLAPPKILFASGPIEAMKLAGTKDMTAFVYGAQDASWLSYFDFCAEVLGLVDETKEIQPTIEFSKNASWTLMFEGLAVVCDHPAEIHVDELGNLHQVGGPALRYDDGTDIWAWHGIDFSNNPTPLRNPDSITEKDILSEENAEMRRALVMLYGPDRLTSKMKEVQTDKFGRLLRWGDELWLEVVNGTPNPFTGVCDKYLLPTDRDVASAREAVARSYGMKTEEYDPDLRV
jgi:hypothetical protein